MVAKMTVEQIGAGRDSVANAVGRMDEINQGSVAIQESVAALDRGSDEIGKIVEVISNIAGQTNLLALNAAIEAARAGEAGRGFSVVAEEVRKLAEESERSSQRIATLVSQNHQDMRKAVEASQAGKEKVENGLASVNQADQVFQSIAVAVEALANEMDNMSSSIKHVAELNKSVLTSISSIDKVSGHNSAEAQNVSAATEEQSAAMQEIASTSEAIDSMAKDLKAMIGKFKV
jgi:Methyl-accepting chemotaxis protein